MTNADDGGRFGENYMNMTDILFTRSPIQTNKILLNSQRLTSVHDCRNPNGTDHLDILPYLRYLPIHTYRPNRHLTLTTKVFMCKLSSNMYIYITTPQIQFKIKVGPIFGDKVRQHIYLGVLDDMSKQCDVSELLLLHRPSELFQHQDLQ